MRPLTAQPLDVSRETKERLEAFVAVLRKWSPRINLIAKSTIDDLWSRHIEDSAQLFALRPDAVRTWADLGTGGGFPGMVIAIMAADKAPEMAVTLVESDTRKASFLHAAARAAAVAPAILCERAELLAPLNADVVSARALAPLVDLLPLAERHLAQGGRALFPKGRGHDTELQAALENWRFSVQKHPSRTDPSGVILSIEGVQRARA